MVTEQIGWARLLGPRDGHRIFVAFGMKVRPGAQDAPRSRR